jgi:Glycosyltransferase involved in LPS biosynthesis
VIAATYIINLASSTERWRTMQPLLDVTGLPNRIRFDAVDGRALGEEGIRAMQEAGRLSTDLSRFDEKTRAGEIGCALSHAGVLADIVRNEWPAAMIFEDDIVLDGDPGVWRKRYNKAFADLPRDWEVWYLYRCFDIEHRTVRITPRTLIPWTPQGGAAYAVTLEGARKMLAALEPVASAVDRIYMDLVKTRQLKAFASSPMLIRPGFHPSVINSDGSRKWVENGVNQPPEYWPDEDFGWLGETIPRKKPAGLLKRIADGARQIMGRAA